MANREEFARELEAVVLLRDQHDRLSRENVELRERYDNMLEALVARADGVFEANRLRERWSLG
jgi:hypothetical protein